MLAIRINVFLLPLPQGLTFFLSYSIFAAVLGMLQFGYNTGVINAPELNIENFMKDVYKDRYGEDISEEFIQQLYSVAVSIFAIGGMLGGFSGGWMANRFGRKGGLLLNNVLGISGACLMGFTKVVNSYEMLFLGRFIIGVNCGKLMALFLCQLDSQFSSHSRSKHVARSHVYIGDCTIEFTRRSRHC
jgi:MFS transporter, SP family, solute carrier family 2 (facilitated glucose transporter), member 1